VYFLREEGEMEKKRKGRKGEEAGWASKEIELGYRGKTNGQTQFRFLVLFFFLIHCYISWEKVFFREILFINTINLVYKNWDITRAPLSSSYIFCIHYRKLTKVHRSNTDELTTGTIEFKVNSSVRDECNRGI
jgi:hypothetical protein